MISLLDQHVDSNQRQSQAVSRIRDFLLSGQYLDEAPDSVLRDLDLLWERIQHARDNGADGVRLSKNLHRAARARALGKFIAPTLDHV
ncbi:MAG: hypothetical protein H8E43_05100 [Planctomycetia bacterium]|jgi:hypothetical protein|nr:hypothetical protein [Planctomycetia bacterium]MBL6913889.1 hypothetical protein [Planctomycetota bacterium]NCG55752.1 hypothetical protein [Pseudomonadota bacterium]MDA9264809.1 hypothetical protein [Planctomycetota bacterium]MDG1455320.1 hypothetical protein [Planctomycetota bacterium]